MTTLKSRRSVVAGIAAGALLGASSAKAAPAPHKKTIPSTGQSVPAIGMGSWLTFDIGGDRTARAQRTEVLRAFFALGGAVIDSSPMYGSSQEVIGDA
ncbi:MAG: aldo/keto reductase, partial [Parvularculaceae bacterium]